MDFLAGALLGTGLTALGFCLAVAGSVNTMSSRIKRLEESIYKVTREETIDEADYWKHGISGDDEEHCV